MYIGLQAFVFGSEAAFEIYMTGACDCIIFSFKARSMIFFFCILIESDCMAAEDFTV